MKHAYSSRLDEALAFTAHAFRGKFRKSTRVPYLTHLLSVAALVGEGGGDEDLVIAALLHDYIEDVPGATAADVESRFGTRVRELVVACSDCEGHPKPPWRERKESYIAHLPHASHDVKLISVADKLHNSRCLVGDVTRHGVVIYERFNAGRDGTLWYYSAVVDALAHEWDHWLLDQLRGEVGRLLEIS